MTAVARLLAWRDKRSSGLTPPSVPVVPSSPRPESWSGDLASIFLLPPENRQKPDKGKDKEPDNKTRTILSQLVASGATIFKDGHVEYALQAVEPPGDSHAAYDLLMAVADSINGHLRPIKPSVTLVGAENRDFVTCYLDSLLFAMFAQIDCFDQMLRIEFQDKLRNQLAQLLRLWVNMLRSGHLITKNITRHLQNALAASGWEEARLVAQQDVSEAFAFITEAMGLPLLTLKVDLFHTGKESRDDDHKFVNERLLDVAVPLSTEDGSSVPLESCLESYFNSKVEIKRILQRRNTLRSVRSIDSDKELEAGSPMASLSPTAEPAEEPSSSSFPLSPLRSLYNRSLQPPSIFRPKNLPFEPRTRDDLDLPPYPRSNTKHKREVLMPAWQFFQLLPWFPNPKPKSNAQVAEHFKVDRPVLGICLKRYYLSPTGEPCRSETRIDIPLEFSLPHFISETTHLPLSSSSSSSSSRLDPLFTRFKLSLEAIVCHRGKSIDAGHYISLVRPHKSLCLGENGERSDLKWLVFDDLNPQARVRVVDINEALEHELPYLLFYRVVPMNGDVEVEYPPSYGEAIASSAIPAGASMLGLSGGAGAGSATGPLGRAITPTIEIPAGPNFATATTTTTNTPHRASQDDRSQVSFSSFSFANRGDGSGQPAASPFLSPQVPSRTPSYARMARLSLDDRFGLKGGNMHSNGSCNPHGTGTGPVFSAAAVTSEDVRSSGGGGGVGAFFSLRSSKRKKAKESKDKDKERESDRDRSNEKADSGPNGSREKTLTSFFSRPNLQLSSSRSSGQLSSLKSPRFFPRLPQRSSDKSGTTPSPPRSNPGSRPVTGPVGAVASTGPEGGAGLGQKPGSRPGSRPGSGSMRGLSGRPVDFLSCGGDGSFGVSPFGADFSPALATATAAATPMNMNMMTSSMTTESGTSTSTSTGTNSGRSARASGETAPSVSPSTTTSASIHSEKRRSGSDVSAVLVDRVGGGGGGAADGPPVLPEQIITRASGGIGLGMGTILSGGTGESVPPRLPVMTPSEGLGICIPGIGPVGGGVGDGDGSSGGTVTGCGNGSGSGSGLARRSPPTVSAVPVASAPVAPAPAPVAVAAPPPPPQPQPASRPGSGSGPLTIWTNMKRTAANAAASVGVTVPGLLGSSPVSSRAGRSGSRSSGSRSSGSGSGSGRGSRSSGSGGGTSPGSGSGVSPTAGGSGSGSGRESSIWRPKGRFRMKGLGKEKEKEKGKDEKEEGKVKGKKEKWRGKDKEKKDKEKKEKEKKKKKEEKEGRQRSWIGRAAKSKMPTAVSGGKVPDRDCAVM